MELVHGDVKFEYFDGIGVTYASSLALMSSENVSDIGVIATFAVFRVKSKAPAIMLVSWCDNSPPFPA